MLGHMNNLYLVQYQFQNNSIELIFVKAPCTLTEDDQKKYNYILDYANKNSIKYIDYNKKIGELGLTYGDYYDNGHLSGQGAVKVSRSFAKYIHSL